MTRRARFGFLQRSMGATAINSICRTMHKPQFPVYIPSKGRARYAYTMGLLNVLGVDYRVIVEAPEFADYADVLGADKLLALSPAYQRNYDDCDALGDAKPHGAGPARNMAWDHAVS